MQKAAAIRHTLIYAALIAIFCVAAPPASAENAPAVEERSEIRLELFAALKSAPSETSARQIENRIWEFWTTGPDSEATLMLADAMGRRRSFDYAGALTLLDMLVEAEPGWSEAWNQRAFVRFLREEYAASLEDIERTLALEPKHFGAMAGKADILFRLGDGAAGQEVLREAVDIHPWMGMRAMLEKPAGRDI